MQLITKITHIQKANTKFVSDCDLNKTGLIDRKFITIVYFSQVCRDTLNMQKFKKIEHYHSVNRGINLPSKTPSSFLLSPTLNLQCPSLPF